MKPMMSKDKKNSKKTTKTTISIHHPLMEKIMGDLKPIIQRSFELLKEGERKNKVKEGEKYIFDSFERLTLLEKRERQFIESINFLDQRPAEALLKRYKMSHQEFIEYHHDTLLSFYTSYSECAYQCVNQILNLGIPAKSVNASILKGHKWILETNLSKHISSLEKLRMKHAHYRNQTTHQGRSMEIEELNWYLQFDYLADSPEPADDLKSAFEDHKKVRRPLYKFKAKTFLAPIRSDFEESTKLCNDLLSDMIVYYEFWTGKGKKLASKAYISTIKSN